MIALIANFTGDQSLLREIGMKSTFCFYDSEMKGDVFGAQGRPETSWPIVALGWVGTAIMRLAAALMLVVG